MVFISKKILSELDVYSTLFLAILGIFFVLLYFISPVIYLFIFGVSILFGSILYLFIKNKNYFFSFSETNKLKLVYEVLFFVSFIGSLYVLQIYEMRTLFYFILISFCTAMLSLSIFFVDMQKNYFQILKIYLLSLNLKYSIFFLYDGFTMPDSWRHATINSLIALTGHFTQFNNIDSMLDKEFYFPLMHIYVAMNQVFFGVGVKEASNLSLIIPMVLSSICVYLFARKYFSEKVGLFSMLIMNITDFNTLWGSAPQTTTYGSAFFCYLLYLFSESIYSKSKFQFRILMILFIFSLILGHGISSFIFLTTLIGLSIGSIIFELISHDSKPSFFSFNIILITFVSIIQDWMGVEYLKNGASFFDTVVYLFNNALLEYSGFLNRPESISNYVTTLPPFIERFADHFGLMVIIFFSVIGGLLLLSSKYRNKSNFSILFCLVFLLSISLGFPLFGMNNLVPERWFIFEYFFLSIISSFGIVQLSKLIYCPKLARCFIIVIFFILSFFMSTSTISNSDNPFWLKESTISSSFSVNEVKGAETISKFSENISTDPSYFLNIFNLYLEININIPFEKIVSNSDKIIKSNFSSNGEKIYVWRRNTINQPIPSIRESKSNNKVNSELLHYTTTILGSGIVNKLEQHNKIYDNHNTVAYYL